MGGRGGGEWARRATLRARGAAAVAASSGRLPHAAPLPPERPYERAQRSQVVVSWAQPGLCSPRAQELAPRTAAGEACQAVEQAGLARVLEMRGMLGWWLRSREVGHA